MRELVWSAFALGAAGYTAAAVLYFRELVQRAGGGEPRWAPALLAGGGLSHLAYTVLSSAVDRRCPIYSLHTALGLAAIVAVFAFLALGRGRRLGAVGAAVAVSALMLFLGSRWIVARPPGPFDRWLLAVHITTNLLGLGVLVLAGMASGFYLWQERLLKQKRRAAWGNRLPPLESLDAVVHRLLWVALPLLTLGIASGMIVLRHAATVSRGEVLRAGFSYLSWGLVAGVWTVRQTLNWRGRRPAYATLAGATCIVIVIALYLARDVWWSAS